MVKLYLVSLSDDQRQELDQLISRGKLSARVNARARILLKAAVGASDEQIVEAVGTCRATVERVRRRFATGGRGAAIKDKPQAGPLTLRHQSRRRT